MEKYQLFIKAYNTINLDIKRFHPYLKNSSLSYTEKRLLKSVLLISKDAPKDALAILEAVHTDELFFKGYRSYLIGLAYNHIGSFDHAAKHLVHSIQYFQKGKYQDHLYKPISVITKVYFNLKDLQRLEKYYQVFLSFKDSSRVHDILNYEYLIFFSILKGNVTKGISLIDELLLKHNDLLKRSLSTYYILKIMLLVQDKSYDQCHDVLKQYKNCYGYKVKQNYIFIISLLNFIFKDAPIYVYKRDFQTMPLLFNQLKVIKSLQLHNMKEAKKYWNELKAITPHLYLEDFKYQTTNDLFALSLNKALLTVQNTAATQEVSFNKAHLQTMRTAGERLEYILAHSNSYIEKEELIKLIWNEDWSEKNDNRLRALIFRLKKRKSLEIDIKNGKYKKVA